MKDIYDKFLAGFGPIKNSQEIPSGFFESKPGVFPEQFALFLKREGWGAYGDGLIWTVNPDDFTHVAGKWLSSFPDFAKSKIHIFARTAFGKLYAFDENTGRIITISCPFGSIMVDRDMEKPVRDRDLTIALFFGMAKKDFFDMPDEDDGYLFDPAVAKLGGVSKDQLYGFDPVLSSGGTAKVENLRKLSIDTHLSVLAESSGKRISRV